MLTNSFIDAQTWEFREDDALTGVEERGIEIELEEW